MKLPADERQQLACEQLAGLDDGTLAYSRDAGMSWTRTAPLVANPSGRGNTARAEIAFGSQVADPL